MTKKIFVALLCLIMLLTLFPLCVSAVNTSPKITNQPTNGYAEAGEKVSVSVDARGEELQYQWYLKNPGQKKFYESSIKTDTYTTTMSWDISGRQVYCVITDAQGNTVTSDTVTLKIPTALKITEQPENVIAAVGKSATVSFTAEGDELKYQWYLKNPGQTKFHKSAITKEQYSIIMTEKASGRQVYCAITDRNGNSVTTATVTLKTPTELKITNQPQKVYAAAGESAATAVTAQGDGLTYQWYLKNPGQTKFYQSAVTKAQYATTMNEQISGRQVYCVVTDCYGNSVTSNTVTLEIPPAILITQQPANGYARVNEVVSTAVAAKGNGLTYQWYLKNPGQTKFYQSSVTKAQYTAVMTEKISGRQVYCVITDKDGNTLTTNTVTLEILPAILITRQPANGYAFPGETVTTSVTAKGEGLTYQWYLKNPDQNKFYKSAVTKPDYAATMKEEISGRQVYCVITDKDGNTVQTETATLWRNGVFQKDLIKMRPDSTKDLAPLLTFHTASILEWESSDPSIATVNDTGTVTGIQYGTVTITVTDRAANATAKCEVKICDLKQVALTFDDGPSNHTARLLDFLEENPEVKVTFFMVGNRMKSFSTSVERIAAQGHELGYHSYSHQMQTGLSDATIYSDYQKADEILFEITGKHFTLWRTPGGDYNTRVLNALPLPHIMWSVDTRDWATRNSSAVYSSIITYSKDGSIVLLHDLHGTTVDGSIAAMKKMLQDGDYEFVTVTELLSRDGTPPQPHVSYTHAG